MKALPRERVGPRVKIRLPEPYIAALKVLALRTGTTVSQYMRDLVKHHLRQVGSQFGETGARLDCFIRSLKQFILTYREHALVCAGLPAKPRREELEHLAWDAVLRAYEFAKGEEAAANAKVRLRAMEVLANLIRAERLILLDQDRAAVDEIIEELQRGMDDLGKEIEQGAGDATSAER